MSKNAMPVAPYLAKTELDRHIFAAASAGDAVELRAALAKHPAGAMAFDNKGRTALIFASGGSGDNIDCVLELLPLSDATAKTTHQGRSALMWAALRGHEKCIRALLPASDASATTHMGFTALMLAACCGHAHCVEALLAASEPDARDASGENALMLAAKSGSASCVAALLPVSDALAKNNEGKSALWLAAWENHLDCARLLVARSDAQSVSAPPLRGSALHCAVQNENVEMVRLLLPLSNLDELDQCEGPRRTARGPIAEGATALNWAIQAKSWGCADLIAASESTKKAKELMKMAPKDKTLPMCRARVESEELRGAASVPSQEARAAEGKENKKPFPGLARRI